MSEGERIQKAVSFTLSSGFQLDKEAFEFLNLLSKQEDPLFLMEETVKKIRDLSQKPLFIDRPFLESMKNISCVKEKTNLENNFESTVSESKKSFRPYAKDIEDEVKVLIDPTKKICTTGSMTEYLAYFQDRYKRLKKILRKRMDVKNAIPLAIALKTPIKSKIIIIGMVTEKSESK